MRRTTEHLGFIYYLTYILVNRDALKGLGIGFTLATLSTLTATFIITTYSVTIFQTLRTSIDPYVSSITLAVALIWGAIISTYLADKLGRKKLNLISLSGTAFGLLIAALYHYLNINGIDLTSFAWIAVFSLCLSIIISAAGIVPLAMVCSVENLPSKVCNRRSRSFSIREYKSNISLSFC